MNESPSYRLIIRPAASRQVRKLPRPIAGRVLDAIEELQQNPRPPGAKALAGKAGELRIRCGDYRVIYEVRDAEVVVLVLRVGHRREIYRNL